MPTTATSSPTRASPTSLSFEVLDPLQDLDGAGVKNLSLRPGDPRSTDFFVLMLREPRGKGELGVGRRQR